MGYKYNLKNEGCGFQWLVVVPYVSFFLRPEISRRVNPDEGTFLVLKLSTLFGTQDVKHLFFRTTITNETYLDIPDRCKISAFSVSLFFLGESWHHNLHTISEDPGILEPQ